MPQGNILPEGSLIGCAENERLLSCREGLVMARDRRTVLEAIAERCGLSHELVLRLPGVRAIIPRAEAALGISDGSVRDIAILSRVGKPVTFRITDISGLDSHDPYILCSRRLVQQEAQTILCRELLPGDILKAKVTHSKTEFVTALTNGRSHKNSSHNDFS